MSENKDIQFLANSVRICFDSNDQEMANGRICGVALENQIYFHGMTDFVVKIDEAFNIIGRPQPTRVLRSFSESTPYQSFKGTPEYFYTGEEIGSETGNVQTVDLVMLSRHRSEWQGTLKDIDGQLIGKFDTILECINLIEQIQQKKH